MEYVSLKDDPTQVRPDTETMRLLVAIPDYYFLVWGQVSKGVSLRKALENIKIHPQSYYRFLERNRVAQEEHDFAKFMWTQIKLDMAYEHTMGLLNDPKVHMDKKFKAIQDTMQQTTCLAIS